jgi:tetratricopeptide (TPR) repeat protein
MARLVLILTIVALLNLFAGCGDVDTGRARLLAADIRQPHDSTVLTAVADAGESDIVEQVAVNRQAYREGLFLLVGHYEKIGDNMKLIWAQKELSSLDAIPQYNYIVEASIAGPGLKPTDSIAEADELYADAVRLGKKAREFIIIPDDELLRLALGYYNRLIKRYPSSNKVSDAAFRAGEIYRHFHDYTLAVLYYQRAYQWDPRTANPARFRAAHTLDQKLHRRAEALDIYKQAVEKESQFTEWKIYAEKRIRVFSGQDTRGDY